MAQFYAAADLHEPAV